MNPQFMAPEVSVAEGREKWVHPGDPNTAALGHITEGPADVCLPGYCSLMSEGPKSSCF